MTANDIRFAPDARFWLPIPEGEARATVGRDRWVDRAALMLRMTNLENADFLASAREECGRLWDRADEGQNVAFFPVEEPYPMLATMYDEPTDTPAEAIVGGSAGAVISRDDTPLDHPFLDSARRTMTVERLGDRVLFGVDFAGETADGRRIGLRGSTDQPQVAGQFAALGRELFLTMSPRKPVHAG